MENKEKIKIHVYALTLIRYHHLYTNYLILTLVREKTCIIIYEFCRAKGKHFVYGTVF